MKIPMSSSQENDVLKIGDWTACFQSCTLNTKEPGCEDLTEVKVTPRSMEVLKYLSYRPGIVISLSDIIAEVWGRSTCTDHLVHKAVAELRSALCDSVASPSYIKTVPKRGYILIADVEHSSGIDCSSVPEAGFGLENSGETDAHGRSDEPEESSLRVSRNILRRPGFVSFVALVLVSGVLLTLNRNSDTSTAQNQGIRLLVPEFVNHDLSESGLDLYERINYAIYNGLSKIDDIDIFYDMKNVVVGSQGYGLDSAQHEFSDPTHILRGAISTQDSRKRIYFQLFDAESGMQLYAQRFDVDSERIFILEDEISENIASVIRYQQDKNPDLVAEMSGTNNIVAYERYQQGMMYYNQFNPDDFRSAIKYFNDAIRLDPDFTEAYLGVVVAANNLAARGLSSTIEEMYEIVDGIHRELLRRGSNQDAIELVNSVKQRMRGSDFFGHEKYLRDLILSDSRNSFAVAHYALMLISARMYDEGEQLLDVVQSPDEKGLTPDEAASYRSNIMTPEEMIKMDKSLLLKHPHNITIINRIATNLSFIKEHEQAEIYLKKLEHLDTEGILYHRARMMADYFTGRFDNDNAIIAETLVNNPDYFYNNGLLCFMMGNLEQGIAYWSAMPLLQRRQIFNDLHRSEKYFAPHIVESSRYQLQLENLGIGRQWQRRLTTGFAEIAQKTGAVVSLLSLRAYEENRLMTRNNLWNEEQWSMFNMYRDSQIVEGAASNLDHGH